MPEAERTTAEPEKLAQQTTEDYEREVWGGVSQVNFTVFSPPFFLFPYVCISSSNWECQTVIQLPRKEKKKKLGRDLKLGRGSDDFSCGQSLRETWGRSLSVSTCDRAEIHPLLHHTARLSAEPCSSGLHCFY